MKDLKNKIINIYQLTSMQQGMLFHSIKDSDSGVYTEQTILDIKGNLNIELFEKTFNYLIEKYEIFRTAFVYNKLEEPKQVVLSERKIEMEVFELKTFTKEQAERRFQEILYKDKVRGFDIEKDTLLRLKILVLSEDRYKIIWTFHHMIMDGWCIGLLLKDITNIYGSLIKGEEVELGDSYNYSSYIKWIQNQNLNDSLKFWENYLSNIENTSILMETDAKNSEYKYEEYNVDLDKSYIEKVKSLSRKYDVTESTIFQTIWGLLLQKYNNSNDSVFGTVVSGRGVRVPHVEEMIGLFINTLPVRVKGNDNLSFIELARKVQNNFNEARDYEYTPLTSIQKVTESQTELINSLFVYENYPMSSILKELKEENTLGFVIEKIRSIEQTSYDFNIIINPNNDMPIEFKYNGGIYDKDCILVIEDSLKKIIKEVTNNEEILIKDIKIVSEEMEEKIDSYMDFESSAYDKNVTINSIFEKMAEKFPENIAVSYKDENMTYAELNERANKIARRLRKLGVDRNTIVGILLDKSIEMTVSILGILKAGGAYMPIDVNYPEDRKQYMLDDSKAAVVISEEKYIKEVNFNDEIVIYSEAIENIKETTNIENINSQDDMAYIIYTSGSTGKPKGTMIEHKNVIRLLFNSDFMFDFDEKDVWTLAHSFCFDFSVWEMYGALLRGGKLVILPTGITMDPQRFVEVLESHKVTVLNQTPLSFYGIIDEVLRRSNNNISLKYVIFGGEALTPKKLKPWRELYPNTHLINMYGITETTVHVTFKEILEDDMDKETSNIGRPIPTLSVYILDKNYNRLPINVPGEICVSGDGVCRGYLNREDLTNKKFIDNPFKDNSKLYCSGDLGKVLPNGELEYMGRIDNQIKIRGFRVEIGEIEAKLRENINIKDAVVLPKVENGTNSLYAYIIFNNRVNISEIRKSLSKELPYYMIPSYFIEIDKIPYTSNHKIDRKKLLSIEEVIESDTVFEKAADSKEEVMMEVWKSVLSKKNISRNDNFFELGGDSIKAIQIISRLKKYNLNLNVKNVMQYPVLHELCRFVTEDKSLVSQKEIIGQVRLTPIQMEFLNTNEDVNKFNHAINLCSKEKLDDELVKEMFEILIKHHDAIRMKFEKNNDGFIAFNEGYKENMFDFSSIDLGESNDEEIRNKIKDVLDKKNNLIDISEGKMLSVTLFHGIEKDYLSIILHHLVVDGVSWRILLENIENIYDSLKNNKEVILPKKTTSFKEWADNIYFYAQKDEVKEEGRSYWNNVIGEDKGCDKSLVNYEQNMIKVSKSLSEEKTKDLIYEVNKKYGTEINDILITALGMAINEWKNTDRAVVSLESHGRNHDFKDVDITNTIGWFTNNYPIVLERFNDKELDYNIRSVKEMLRNVPSGGFNYSLLKYLTKDSDITFKDYLPKYSFNYMGQYLEEEGSLFQRCDMPIGDTISDKNITLFDIDINAIVEKECFVITFRYNTDKYDETEINELGDKYIESLNTVIDYCLSKTEKVLSPSDLGYSDFTIDELDDLLDDLDDIE